MSNFIEVIYKSNIFKASSSYDILLTLCYAGKGDMFSGSDIVHWMVQNIAGVEDEQDGETLGQILLDQGAIFHSEGSRY